MTPKRIWNTCKYINININATDGDFSTRENKPSEIINIHLTEHVGIFNALYAKYQPVHQ